MPQINKNFDIREFVPKFIWEQYGMNSTWFIQEKVVKLAQFYKDFFTKYFKNKDTNVKEVLICINNWHYAPLETWQEYRGFRPCSYIKGSKLSQHRLGNAFDCDIIIKYNDGTKKEGNYQQIHHIILKEYEQMFFDNGLRAIEDISIAKTWLHSDCRWIPSQKEILVVKPKNF